MSLTMVDQHHITMVPTCAEGDRTIPTPKCVLCTVGNLPIELILGQRCFWIRRPPPAVTFPIFIFPGVDVYPNTSQGNTCQSSTGPIYIVNTPQRNYLKTSQKVPHKYYKYADSTSDWLSITALHKQSISVLNDQSCIRLSTLSMSAI